MGKEREGRKSMLKMNLYFTGRRYAVRTARVGDFVQVEPNGIIRYYKIESPSGLWRTFSEANLGSQDHVAELVGRYGDPMAREGAPVPDVFSSKQWKPLQDVLKTAAATWTDKSSWIAEKGLSENLLFPDHDERRLAAMRAIDAFGPITIRTETGAHALGLRVSSLADHLQLSARIMLGAATPMRRCDYCGFWLAADHKATRFCDAVCRNNAAKGRPSRRRII
jgi:hypothetical protein